MKTGLRHPLLVCALRWLVGGIFLYAGVMKLRDPEAFAAAITTFRFLPEAWIGLVSTALPIFEILVGTLLIIGWRVRAAVLAALMLAAVFLIALGQARLRGLEVNCGCFGEAAVSRWEPGLSFMRDLLLMAATGALYAAAGFPRSPSRLCRTKPSTF